MTPDQLDQMIFETTQHIDNEISKLKNLTTARKFTREDQEQQAKNWKNLRTQKEKTAQRSQQERDQTSRKIIIGGLYLSKMQQDPEKYAPVFSMLEKTLTRDRDRKLFGFETLSTEEKSKKNLNHT